MDAPPPRNFKSRRRRPFPSTVALLAERRAKECAEKLDTTPEREYYTSACAHCGRDRVWNWRWHLTTYCTAECARAAANERARKERAARRQRAYERRWREDEEWLARQSFPDHVARETHQRRRRPYIAAWLACRAAAKMTEVSEVPAR